MKVIKMTKINGIQCGIVHITNNRLLRNGYYYVIKRSEFNQELRFFTGGRITKNKTELANTNFLWFMSYALGVIK